jgi:three-Cys-motif partner protein
MPDTQLDKVGLWTEVKLDILRGYSKAYAQILNKQRAIRHYAYIDGFAGAGTHISKTSGQEIDGSPSIALQTNPPFSHCHFIDLDGKRATRLEELASGRDNVSVYCGDCNDVLLNQVFPKCRYDQYRRALCVLDPYDLNPMWEVVQTAGQMKSVEIFLNFMLMDANMNVLWKNPEQVDPGQVDRMNAFWGDNSWRRIAYKSEQGLFGPLMEKAPNKDV